MKIIKTENYTEMSEKAFKIISEDIIKKPNLVIGFATGATPVGLYKKLATASKTKKLDFSKIKSFNLDEYYPIQKKNKNSYYYYMHKNLFDKINIKKSNINLLNGENKNPNKECRDYENKIKKNKINIQILGIGVNGHIGFNEPGSELNSKTRLVNLSEQTIKANSRYFKNKKQMPKQALTMGIQTILKSKKIILLASGKNKAQAIKQLIRGKPTSKWPASFLKKHKNLIVIIDKGASGLLR